MKTFYAFYHTYGINTVNGQRGRRIGQVYGFETKKERDDFVAEYHKQAEAIKESDIDVRQAKRMHDDELGAVQFIYSYNNKFYVRK